jgi:hypothetical protein
MNEKKEESPALTPTSTSAPSNFISESSQPATPVGTREPMPKFFDLINSIKKQPSRTLDEWHLALAHISKNKILKLQEMGTIKIKDPDGTIDCLPCQSAKMKRKKFEKSMPPKADNVGEVLYSDVCGKISPPTIFGEKYFVSFIDEKSGYVFVNLIKKKSEVFSRFKEVLALVNNQNASTSVKMFVSDGGGEYIGEVFQSLLKEKGIIHVKTPPNTPQRNGKSERLNKILFDLARAMLKSRELPRRFWGEAILYAAYIINRTPKNNNDQSRHEMLFGKKPTLEKTLEFGMPVYFHNHDAHIKKLEDRAFEGMFLGFWEDDHTYKILDFSTNHLISTRTISSHPQHLLKFEDNDWEKGFPVENDDNWVTGLSDAPQYIPFNNFQLPDYRLNINDNSVINNKNNDNPIINIPVIPPIIENNNINNNPPPIPVVENRSHQNEKEEEDDGDYEEDEDIMGNPIRVRRSDQAFNALIPEDQKSKTESSQICLSLVQVENILSLSEIKTPITYKQAINGRDGKEWERAISAEQKSLLDLNTFELVDRPVGKLPITAKYVFKIKTDEKGAISKYKARLVARGFQQSYGENFKDVFSPTLRMDSIRFLISTAVQNQMKVHHLDVQTAFLNGTLAEEIYMEIPEGFDEKIYDKKSKVFKLKKSIYGLKQASRVWNELFTNDLKKSGLIQSAADPCIFLKYPTSNKVSFNVETEEKENSEIPIALIGVFVDDCFVVGGDEEVKRIKNQLMNLYKMHDLGPLNFALGIKFDQNKDFSIQMSQALYVDKLLEKFEMIESKIVDTPLPQKNSTKPKKPEEDEEEIAEPKSPLYDNVNKYQQLVGSLIYLSNSTRPDIAHAVSYLSRHMHAPTEDDMMNGKRVLRYLKGSRTLALNYNQKDQELVAYSDSSYAEEEDRKSVGGYVTLQAGAAITWKSTKQRIVAQSSMEAEYIALAEAAKEVEWLRKLQAEIRPKSLFTPTTMYEDNQSAINLSNNPIHTTRSKHIAVRYHRIQELVSNQTISIVHMPTDQMIADIMTKSLGRILHARFVTAMGLVSLKK